MLYISFTQLHKFIFLNWESDVTHTCFAPNSSLSSCKSPVDALPLTSFRKICKSLVAALSLKCVRNTSTSLDDAFQLISVRNWRKSSFAALVSKVLRIVDISATLSLTEAISVRVHDAITFSTLTKRSSKPELLLFYTRVVNCFISSSWPRLLISSLSFKSFILLSWSCVTLWK